jgi:arylformamidase
MSVIIDLSHTIESGMPVYPGTEPPTIKEACSLEKDGFRESLFSFYSHIGTHLDVPAHIFSNGKSVELFDSNKYFGTAMVIDCTSKSSIDLDAINNALSNSPFPDFMLFHTGWSDYWGQEKYFSGFPVLTEEAAKYISTLPVKGLGIDAISFDAVGNHNLTNHKILLEKEIILVENLCSLNNLPKENFYFSCLPLKIAGADGAPARAFAINTKDLK